MGNLPYFIGFLFSLVAHLTLAVLAIVVLEANAGAKVKPNEVFTVTLEGGQKLGGITQLPEEGKQNEKITEDSAPIDVEEPAPEEVAEVEPAKPEKKLEEPSVVEDPERVLALKKKQEEEKKKNEEKKKAEEKKKKEEEKKKAEAKKKAEEAKKRAAEKKRKEELARKKKEEAKRKKEQEKKRKAAEKRDRDIALKKALAKARKRYSGESTNAGGEGLGAARTGAGRGGGGGRLAGIQKLRYDQALNRHVKSGWKWLAGRESLEAVVEVRLDRDGTIRGVNVMQSSGNRNFDNSVVRAVQKASPVPPPPDDLYQQYYRFVQFTFRSKED